MNGTNSNFARDNRAKARAVRQVWSLVFDDHYTVLDACTKVGIHHSQYYRWKKLAEAEVNGDVDAWKPKSKRPKKFARETPDNVRVKIVSLARSGNYRSANSIAVTVRKELRSAVHVATVIKILENEGLYGVIDVRSADGRLLRKKRGLKVKIEN